MTPISTKDYTLDMDIPYIDQILKGLYYFIIYIIYLTYYRVNNNLIYYTIYVLSQFPFQ